MKKTTIFLTLAMAFQLNAEPVSIENSISPAAYKALGGVFDMAKLKGEDGITLENTINVSGELYIVSLNDSVMVISKDGKYVFSGDFVNLDEKLNYTDEAKEKSIKRLVSKLNSDNYIRYPALNDETKGVAYVYSDLTCGYCKLMHDEYEVLNAAGIEVRVVPFIRTMGMEGVEQTDNYKNTVAMMSIQDETLRKEAHDSFIKDKTPEGLVSNRKGLSAVRVGIDSGVRVGLAGTPHIVLDNGKTFTGMVKANVLISQMDLNKI